MARDPTAVKPEGFFARVTMSPIHFAAFGVFLGVMLVHISTTAILLLSAGIAAFLYATPELFGWQLFVDRSDYAGTLANIDMALVIFCVCIAGIAFCVDMVRRSELSQESDESEAAEIETEPPPVLVGAITILGWLSLSFVAAGMFIELPGKLCGGTLDIFRIMASIVQFEIDRSLMQRIYDIQSGLGFLIYPSAYFFYSRAKERQHTASQKARLTFET